MDIISSVDHPRSDLVGLLMMSGSVQYVRHQYYITGPLGQCQPCREGVNILGRQYEKELGLLNVYLYCMFPSHKTIAFVTEIMLY